MNNIHPHQANETVNLCSNCKKHIATCISNPTFGTGKGNDNVYKCDAFQIKKIEISHARDVYPYCSGEFASGVHLYLHGEAIPKRPCQDELIQGWICAERDLKDNYEKI